MKNRSIKINILVLFALSIFVFSSCKKINLDSTSSNINTNVFVSPIVVQFQNANLTSPNQVPGGNNGFPVTISGSGAQYVVASDGSNVYRVSHGVLALALLSTASPSANNPITFNISGAAGNFAPVSQTITITDTGISSVVVKTVEFTHPVEGTGTFINRSHVNNGVSPGIILKALPTASLSESATITIPVGTEFRDENNQIIQTDSVTTLAIQYGTGTEASLSAFPGGFNAQNILDRDRLPILGGGTFVTAGLMQINMVAKNGTQVKKFSSPIQLDMEINETLQNPTTGENMKEGDTIPIWSLNEQSGQWQYENTVTIKKAISGKLYASFGVSHLSTWNMDFLYHNYINKSPNKMTVKFHLPQGVRVDNYTPELQYASNNQYISAMFNATLYDGLITVMQPVPNIPNTKLVVYDNQYNKVNATVNPSIFNPASVGTVDVTLTPPPSPDYINLKLNIWGNCSNKNTNINLGTWVYFWPSEGNYNWNDLKLCYIATNGWSYNNPVRLKANTNYNCATWYGGAWNSNIIQVRKQNYTFPSYTSDGVTITGSGIYSSQSNTLTINCSFKVRCN